MDAIGFPERLLREQCGRLHSDGFPNCADCGCFCRRFEPDSWPDAINRLRKNVAHPVSWSPSAPPPVPLPSISLTVFAAVAAFLQLIHRKSVDRERKLARSDFRLCIFYFRLLCLFCLSVRSFTASIGVWWLQDAGLLRCFFNDKPALPTTVCSSCLHFELLFPSCLLLYYGESVQVPLSVLYCSCPGMLCWCWWWFIVLLGLPIPHGFKSKSFSRLIYCRQN